MEKTKLEVGDVVQLHPDADRLSPCFRGCFMVVSEPKDWGAQGYIMAIPSSKDESPAQCYLRVAFEDMVMVGHATWLIK